MVSCDKGKIIMEGSRIEIISEMSCLMREVLEEFGEETYNKIVKNGKRSEEETRDEIVASLVNLIFGGK